jgi:hypothetical protein
VIGDLRLAELAGDVADLLDTRSAEFTETNDVGEEVYEAIQTLAELGAADRADTIIDACLNLNFRLEQALSALGVLGSLQDLGVVDPLMEAISERHDWLTGEEAEAYVKARDSAQTGPGSRPARYSALLDELIGYQSEASIEFLHELFDRGDAYDLHKAEILRSVGSLVPRHQLIQGSFVRSFGPIAGGLLHHENPELRRRAFRLYSRLAEGEDRVAAVKAGLVDACVSVQVAAVQAVADFDLQSLKPGLEMMHETLEQRGPLDEEEADLKWEIEDALELMEAPQ